MGLKLKLKKWLATKLKRVLAEDAPVLLSSDGQLSVGKQSYHNGNFEIRGGGSKVKIGSFCAIGKDVKLIVNNHDSNFASMQYSFYKNYFNESPFKPNSHQLSIEIGSDVWLGDNVIVLPNISIGHGAIIGAGSVVTKNVAPYSIVAGVPAKHIKYRFQEKEREALLESQWWAWDDSRIKANKDFFFKNLNHGN